MESKIEAICLICARRFYTIRSECSRGRGKTCSRPCYYKRLRLLKRGKNSHFWRGGVSSENKRARESARYKEWRRAIFKRDDYTCQICGARGVELNADHLQPFAKYKDLRYEMDNGRTLCVPCHRKTPTYGVNYEKA